MTPHNVVSPPPNMHHSTTDHTPQASAQRVPVDGSSDASTPRSRVVIGVVVGLALIGGGLFLSAGTNLFKASAAAPAPAKKEPTAGVQLVAGLPEAVAVPEEVRGRLGIGKAVKDGVAVATAPTQVQTLRLAGVTALDPSKLMRVRARFAPAEVVQIASVQDSNTPESHRELRPGDVVHKGDPLGVFYSVDVASKKNDLVDALLQLKLDQEILERAEKVTGSLPEVFMLNARRNVEGDRNAIARALSNLKTWNVPDEDIQAVYKEAEAIALRKGKRDKKVEADWPRVQLLAPADGTIVERNVTVHETVVDNTVNLFQIAAVDRLLVIANAPEDELPTLQGMNAKDRRWTVAVGATEVKGRIEEIGCIIDPNQHTALIKGMIPNPNQHLRAGQFVTVSVEIPKPTDVVEVPLEALIEDGPQTLVFVQPNPDKAEYALRRVVVKKRFEKVAYIRSKPFSQEEALTAEERELGLLPRQALAKDERLLVEGTLELRAMLQNLQTKTLVAAKEPAGH